MRLRAIASYHFVRLDSKRDIFYRFIYFACFKLHFHVLVYARVQL
jgi:hypothetical protein